MTDNLFQSFIAELNGFVQIAEQALETIEKDLLANKGLFSVFTERMFAIRGTAQQLGLFHIAHLAGLGEEISIKGALAEKSTQVRKCVGSLWDAMTTIKYLLEHPNQDTADEQRILTHRLEMTLKSLGGARPTFNADQIAQLLEKRH